MKQKFTIIAILAIPASIFLFGYLRSLSSSTGAHMFVFLPLHATRELITTFHENSQSTHGKDIAILLTAIGCLFILIFFAIAQFSIRRDSFLAGLTASVWLIFVSLTWSLLILIPRLVITSSG
jgi:hypothetical protein